MKVSRRNFISTAIVGGSATLGLRGLRAFWSYPNRRHKNELDYGDLVPDPKGLIDLPSGFDYQVLSRTGEPMDGGFPVPAAPDGMAAFQGTGSQIILIRNHELAVETPPKGDLPPKPVKRPEFDPGLIYDPLGGIGGTTTLIYDTRGKKLERQFWSLTGTVLNCAGGKTPWNSWVSCEETTQRADERHAQDHGFNFEVHASALALSKAVPLKAMGRFKHEAVAVDVATGIVYQTEDRPDSLLYRFIPNVRGNLAAGGKLQALRIDELPSADTSNSDKRRIEERVALKTSWIDLDDVESPRDDLRTRGAEKGAARFARGEGIWAEAGEIYFSATSGGAAKCGQIWRYSTKPSTLELFAESPNTTALEKPDNITIAPWGDLLACEDGPGENRVVGITPDGRYYALVRNALNDSEITGGVFSPDGSTFFLNIQRPGITVAITGPWKS